jgi:NAD+ dependent glucose-6-phosphate dehydrogenase
MILEDHAARTKVLLTGAAGRIGSAFREHAGERYDLRLVVEPGGGLEDPGPHEVIECDISDLESCRRACRNVDAVLHLAADPSPSADFYGSLLDNNIKGTYNVFRAAKDAGCRRVVFASSVHAVDGYPKDFQVHPDDPVRPPDLYGVSKCFGEALARYFADAEGLSGVAVRIGGFSAEGPREAMKDASFENMSYYVSARDLCQLFIRCLETPEVSFAIVHGLSGNRFNRMDITSARETLGYEPEDDAFEVLDRDG